jgi:small subunit ribosomal protein S13
VTRIAGVYIPKSKKIFIAITYIYGIGKTSSLKILKNLKINHESKVNQLSLNDVKRITNIIEKFYLIEGKLRSKLLTDVKNLIDMKSYRGIRHMKNLPVRGQRTHTNAKTRKNK